MPLLVTEHSKVYFGNSLDVLPTLEDNSVDSIVTDPPYELGFMGKSWDSSGIAYNVELWKECLRVLKPGGHLLSFGGTRTWHRVAVAIEDSGFEIRDSIAWMYGSGFPKSLDVSKAIDKGTGENKQRQLKFTEYMRRSGLSQTECSNLLLPFAKNKDSAKAMAQHYYSDKQQPAIPTAEIFDILKPHLPEVPEEIERLVAERTGIEWTAYKNRRKIGENITNKTVYQNIGGKNESGTIDITESHTSEAKQWEGWGTALKPAFEPIVVARKPLIGTVAQNVLEHGTGALNIDGSRIASQEGEKFSGGQSKSVSQTYDSYNLDAEGIAKKQERIKQTIEKAKTIGRWPANVILDEYSAEILDGQSGTLKSGALKAGRPVPNNNVNFRKGLDVCSYESEANSGGASRFFYCAKASKTDRNEGLEDLEAQRHSDREKDDGVGGDNPRNRTNNARQNFHPTVKPTALMTYLVNLVTPPNGTVLDPFTGSGSTGKAAILAGFNFVGIELTEDYHPIIEGRLKYAEAKLTESKEKEGEALF